MQKIETQSNLNITNPNAGLIAIDNITTNKYLVIYTDNCELTIQKNSEEFIFQQKSFIFVERGVTFSCKIKKENPEIHPYRAIRLDKEELVMLKNIFKSTQGYQFDEYIIKEKPHNKMIRVEGTQEYVRIFNHAELSKDKTLKILKLAYMISHMGITNNILISLMASAAITFTDKVRCVIEKDTSKKWRLSMIADEFNISEISVRKRLESEGTSFNNLLIEIRMNKAMQLLLNNELQIHQISRDVGIFSPSYFIKTFKNYFGITPKQFIIYFRN